MGITFGPLPYKLIFIGQKFKKNAKGFDFTALDDQTDFLNVFSRIYPSVSKLTHLTLKTLPLLKDQNSCFGFERFGP